MLERRSCERYDLELPVNIKWKDISGEIVEESNICKDISSSGMYMLLNNLIEKGSKVELLIDLPIAVEEVKSSRVFARGEVIRNVEEREQVFGHGIKFIDYEFLKDTN